MALAAAAGRAVSTTRAWFVAVTLGRPAATLREATPERFDRWLDTLHALAARRVEQRRARLAAAQATPSGAERDR